ncbi:MAG: hypothetical protein J6X49_12605 [Victivallales bacterium]|nr:hypothetical protein [Victivallales bacterium]
MTITPRELANIISLGNHSLTEDNRAKALFSLTSVIAHIAQACIPELHDLPCKLIAEECLESFRDPSDEFHSDFAKVLSTERPLPNSFHISCDLLFELHPPQSLPQKWRPQLLNIEIQNDSRLLDRCIGRGMLYTSGIYYMEYGTMFSHPNYENARKVHSIWICPSAPPERQGTVMDFMMTDSCAPREGPSSLIPRESYDKFRLTIVNVGGECGRGRKDLPGYIWTLTTLFLSKEERMQILKEDFDMEMTQTVENAAEAYNDWIIDFIGRSRYAEAIDKAEMRGELRGRQEGRQEGELKGRQEGKRDIALNMLHRKYPLDEISKITKLNREEICQIAEDNNLTLS